MYIHTYVLIFPYLMLNIEKDTNGKYVLLKVSIFSWLLMVLTIQVKLCILYIYVFASSPHMEYYCSP